MIDQAALAEKVRELATELDLPGVAVGIVHDGVEQYAFHGVTSIENPLEVDAKTLFQFGSTGKTFTATAVMRRRAPVGRLKEVRGARVRVRRRTIRPSSRRPAAAWASARGVRSREAKRSAHAWISSGLETAKSARWCSPTPKKSRPTRSASTASSTMSRITWAWGRDSPWASYVTPPKVSRPNSISLTRPQRDRRVADSR